MTAPTFHIADYSPAWPGVFERERAHLESLFHPLPVRIEHIGSTSVPGLGAKPVIDILLGAGSLAEIESHIPKLTEAGFQYVPEYESELPDRRYFRRPAGDSLRVHLHAVAIGSRFWRDHLAFRDALRGDEALAKRYLDLKRELARTFAHDKGAYTDAKGPFIRRVLDSLDPSA